MPQRVAAAFLLALAMAGGLRCKPAPLTPQQLLVGQWLLTRPGNGTLRGSNINAWSIEFDADGTWSYDGRTGWLLTGKRLRGAGTWSLKGHTLQLTIDNSVRTAIVQFSGNELILTPDPVLTSPGTGKPVVATYECPPPWN